jgi:prephenate dehydrogenase
MAEIEKTRITIIGLGLIGGSLGLALKAAGLKDPEIIGHDRSADIEVRAQKLGAIDRGERSLPTAVEGATLVIIATPVLAIRQVLEDIAPHLTQGSTVTDTGSTKDLVLQWADELLPASINFVGGHPLAGKETPGIDHAEATLFADKAYAVIPSSRASQDAVQNVVGLIRHIGSRPLFLDAAEHDGYIAAVSHLPLLLSAALFTLVRDGPGWADLAALAASGFQDVTRLASGDPQMAHDICLTNREALLHWLDRMVGELQRYRRLIEGEGQELLQTFQHAQAERNQFLAEGPPRRRAQQLPDVRSQVVTSLVGGPLTRGLRRRPQQGRQR